MHTTSSTKQDSISIKEFLTNYDLEISEYQRPYLWSGQQIIDLYKDLIDFSDNQKDLPNYYLGNIILVKSSKSDIYKIIDGQQRIISLLIINQLTSNKFNPISLEITSKVTADNIKRNAGYLKSHIKQIRDKIEINWELLNITYIIAENDDQAFKFYTTLSTSGKRLAGIDIIKPFHLQAIPKEQQEEKAIQLEKYQFDQNKLENIVKILLRSRYWKGINFRDFPRNHVVDEWKIELENEFVKNTKDQTEDNKYLFGIESKELIQFIPSNYKTDQPLNKGLNSINYILYFAELWDKITNRINEIELGKINDVSYLKGTEFNQEYFQATILTFVSKFGESVLYSDNFGEYIKLVFKICFYTRLSKPVKKDSIYNFEKENQLINRILIAYTVNEIIEFCENYYNKEIITKHIDFIKNSNKKSPTLSRFRDHFNVDHNNRTNPFFN